MINFFKKHGVHFLIAFIVGIILILIHPLILALGNLVVKGIISGGSFLARSLIKLIAENNSYNINNSLMTALVLAVAFVISLSEQFSLEKTVLLEKAVEDNIKSCTAIVEKMEEPPQDSVKGEEDVDLSDLKKEAKDLLECANSFLKNKVLKVKKSISRWHLIAYIYLLLILVNAGVYNSITEMNIKFRNKLIILSEQLSEKEINQIRSRWVQMKNVDDYKEMNKAMKAYMEEYNKILN